MVLLAAAICSKDGKVLLSRQFVEMSKSRIEGLIATFPKLIDSGKQHTFIETDSVRYVYQPLERIFVLLLTTKASNILEDLETLRLFARVIPEYARGSEVADVVQNAFQIIFAFDEIVALGYRENVTLSQIRTYTEMDSHEERMFIAVRENQEKEAKDHMRKRARELQQARIAAAKQGISHSAALNNLSSSKNTFDSIPVQSSLEPFLDDNFGGRYENKNPASQVAPVRRGMQLGGQSGRGGDMDKLVDILKAENPGLEIKKSIKSDVTRGAAPVALINIESLHIKLDEKLTLQANRDGGLEVMELIGVMQVLVGKEEASDAKIHVNTQSAVTGTDRRPPATLQTHPNIDKKEFQVGNWLQTKPGGKTFPIGQEVGVLKWRLQSQNESHIPIIINCWPNEIPGGFEVNIEYELQDTSLNLQNFCITIPLPPGSKSPLIGSCDGDYEVNARSSQMVWCRPLVDADNSSGSLDFTLKAERGTKADLFFPIQLTFSSSTSFCGVEVIEATDSNGVPIKFSKEVNFHPERYEFV